jgi:hypothetical protein
MLSAVAATHKTLSSTSLLLKPSRQPPHGYPQPSKPTYALQATNIKTVSAANVLFEAVALEVV